MAIEKIFLAGILLKKGNGQALHWRGRGKLDRNPARRWRSRCNSGPNRQVRLNKFVFQSNDDNLTAEDIALGYQQQQRVEEKA